MSLIAILDDRLTNRNIYARLAASLETCAEVVTFDDPLLALHRLPATAPDLVITDFKMPHLDGAEFTRRFRACPGCADVPIVVITAYDDRSFRLQALEAGATDFLQSPVDHAEFITRGRNLLRMHRQHRIIEARARDLELELKNSELSRQQLLRDNREALAQVIDTVPAFISAADHDGNIVFINASQSALTDGDPGDVAETPETAPHSPGAPVSAFGSEYEQRSRSLDLLVFKSGKPLQSFEQEVLDQRGRSRILLTTKSPLRNGAGEVGSVLTTSLDITDRKRAERHLQHVASHDGLTDLPNRVLLRERLQHRLARGRTADRIIALHFLDLDRFKEVNDQMGHHLGDMLLKSVAAHLIDCVGKHDTVARIGGDEFAILQTQIDHPDEAAALAVQVIERISRPLMHGGQEVSISGSIGITISPTDGIDAEELLRNADLAMYQAKMEGRNSYRFFVTDMNERVIRTLRIKQELRLALRRDEFVLYYQPQMSLRTGRVAGVEALLRWNHPTSGLLGPNEFLPGAEESTLSAEIDDWVLQRACTDAVQWQHPDRAPIPVAVNLSPVRIGVAGTREMITRVLLDSRLDPSLLELELTERDLVDDLDAAAQALKGLRQLGVSVAIDDFGVGYSSLNYVKSFPVNRVKIDQSFIRDLHTDLNDAAIVKGIIGMAHDLNMTVVAEGVETVEQLTHLAGVGCDQIQGFHFSYPLPLAALLDLLRSETASGDA
ncbi:EAL domain-containing protein [Lichenicola sp.]|uniref:EAL domain-containing response regulator n=1 Tax=Lichenicola sp. TaxID=2804529 RepID=UPI003B0072D4